MKLEFSGSCLRNILKYLKLHKKILPVGAELFHADRRTDRQTWRS